MLKTISTILLSIIVLHGYSQSAYEYFSSINEPFEPINKDTWNYIKQVSRGNNARRIDKKRIELINTLNKAKYEVSQVGAFEGETALRDETRDYLNILLLTLKSDYEKIIDLEQVAEESYDAMEAYILTKERVSIKTEAAFNSLRARQSQFAQVHNIKLIENDSRLSKKLDNAGEVINYYNKVYLLFYKSYWYETKMLTALEENNVGDMEQFRQTLASISKSDMDSLNNLNSFYRDKSLKEACHQLLYFYHGEAVKYSPDQVDFLIKQKNMTDLKGKIESKPKNKLTQQEIDEYNLAINEYNEAVKKFNETSNYLSKFRTQGLENWNKTVEDFYNNFL